MKRRNVFKCMLTAVLLLVSVGGYAQTQFEYDGLTYLVYVGSSEAKLIPNDSNNYAGHIVVPSTIDYYGTTCDVIEIQDTTFVNCKELTSIKIESPYCHNMISFAGCENLVSIQFTGGCPPHYTTHSYRCTCSNDSCSNSCANGSCRCYSNTPHVMFGKSKNKWYSTPFYVWGVDDAFEGCSNLQTIEFPPCLQLREKRLEIQSRALESINIPAVTTELCGYCFSQCYNLRNVTFETIASGICDCSVCCNVCKDLITCHPSVPYQGLRKINNGTFQYCSSLYSITIPDGVTIIGIYAFKFCNLYDIHLPDSLETICMEAFYSGIRGTSLVIPNKVKTIGTKAFYCCGSLENLTIGESVENIYKDAFAECSSLTQIYSLNPTPPNITTTSSTSAKSTEIGIVTSSSNETYSVFDDEIYSQATLFVPEGALSAYQAADGWKNFTNIKEINTTGISSIMADERKQTDEIYDLQGRRLNVPKRGLNIINGKKVIITQ